MCNNQVIEMLDDIVHELRAIKELLNVSHWSDDYKEGIDDGK